MYYDEQPRKKFNWPLVIIIAVALILYVNYTSAPRETDVKNTTSTSAFSRGTEPKPVTNATNASVSAGPLNKCGYLTFGYPDYTGTTNEGQTCADAAYYEMDSTCVLNPPESYDGQINRISISSDPRLTCCVADGTCQW